MSKNTSKTKGCCEALFGGGTNSNKKEETQELIILKKLVANESKIDTAENYVAPVVAAVLPITYQEQAHPPLTQSPRIEVRVLDFVAELKGMLLEKNEKNKDAIVDALIANPGLMNFEGTTLFNYALSTKDSVLLTALFQASIRLEGYPKTLLTELKGSVAEFVSKNSKVISDTMGGEGRNFLHDFSFYITGKSFLKDEAKKTMMDFLIKSDPDFNANFIDIVSSKISPLAIMINSGHVPLIQAIVNSDFISTQASIAETGLSRSYDKYIEYIKLNKPEKAETQLIIGSTIALKYPNAANKALAVCMNKPAASLKYALMLLENNANPIIVVPGLIVSKEQSLSVWDYAWNICCNVRMDENAKKSALMFLTKSLTSPAIIDTINSVNDSYPFLIEELKRGKSIDSIISEHFASNIDHAAYLQHVYHFLKCARDVINLAEISKVYEDSLDPLLFAIPGDSATVATRDTVGTFATMKTSVTKFSVNLDKAPLSDGSLKSIAGVGSLNSHPASSSDGDHAVDISKLPNMHVLAGCGVAPTTELE